MPMYVLLVLTEIGEIEDLCTKRKSTHVMREKVFCIAADFRTAMYEPPSGRNPSSIGCAFNGIQSYESFE